MALNFQSFQVNEKSACLFTPTYLDENGLPVPPTSVTWTLSDQNGNAINGRSNVALTPPAPIVLLAADTALQGPTDQGLRILHQGALHLRDDGLEHPDQPGVRLHRQSTGERDMRGKEW
jgi:hypothetical protein